MSQLTAIAPTPAIAYSATANISEFGSKIATQSPCPIPVSLRIVASAAASVNSVPGESADSAVPLSPCTSSNVVRVCEVEQDAVLRSTCHKLPCADEPVFSALAFSSRPVGTRAMRSAGKGASTVI